MVQEAVTAHRRQHAERDRDGEREQQRRAGQQQRGGEPFEHEPHRVAAVPERFAEVAAERAADEARVLYG